MIAEVLGTIPLVFVYSLFYVVAHVADFFQTYPEEMAIRYERQNELARIIKKSEGLATDDVFCVRSWIQTDLYDEIICNYDLNFVTTKNISLEESRKQMLRVIDRTLYFINNDEKLRPYLASYPFTRENLKIQNTYHPTDRTSSSFMCRVWFKEGKIGYSEFLPEMEREFSGIDSKFLHEETYQEALQKLKNEQTPG